MITIKDGVLVVPESERFIGCVGDNQCTKKMFFVADDVAGDVYRLYLTFKNGKHISVVLEKSDSDSTVLVWNVEDTHILCSGLVNAQLKVFVGEEQVYHTNTETFVASSSIEYDDEYNGSNAEYLQHEKKLNELYLKMISASEKMPYVGENGNWWCYDAVAAEYKDTGISSIAAIGTSSLTPDKFDRAYWEKKVFTNVIDTYTGLFSSIVPINSGGSICIANLNIITGAGRLSGYCEIVAVLEDTGNTRMYITNLYGGTFWTILKEKDSELYTAFKAEDVRYLTKSFTNLGEVIEDFDTLFQKVGYINRGGTVAFVKILVSGKDKVTVTGNDGVLDGEFMAVGSPTYTKKTVYLRNLMSGECWTVVDSGDGSYLATKIDGLTPRVERLEKYSVINLGAIANKESLKNVSFNKDNLYRFSFTGEMREIFEFQDNDCLGSYGFENGPGGYLKFINLENGKSGVYWIDLGSYVENSGSGGADGEDGQDGYSPIANVTQTDSGATITITDKDGTTTATVVNGKDGTDGQNGYTPQKGIDYFDGVDGKDGSSVTINSITESTADGGSNVVYFSDGKTLTVKNGSKGDKGEKGDTGSQGEQGLQGIQGAKGDKGDKGSDGYTPQKGVDYFTEEDITEIVVDVINETGCIIPPSYVLAEAEAVADKVLDARNADSFVFGAVSDLHTTGTDASASSILHAGQGMSEINNLTSLDMYAIFGDIMVDVFDDTYKEGFKFVKKSFAELSKSVPLIQMQGNHDELSTDTTEEARQKYYAYIGANNIGVVTDYDNKHRNYGFRDFENYKIRVIYLNSADVSSDEVDISCYVTAEQLVWLVNIALDFSDKDDSSDWGIIVMSHHPLNWNSTGTMTGNMWAVLNVLDNYKGKTSGTANIDGVAVTWDFSDATAELIAHFHGHLHNFRAETLGANGILSLTIPNACFGRENEYGSFGGDVAELYGDADADGNQRVFTKTSNTKNDTAFNIVTVDRLNRKIYAHCYGAGVDRVWTFEGEQLEGGGNVVVEPQYTNQIPVSTNTDGSLYGYVANTRLNSSGNAVTAEGLECTGFIPCKYGDVVRFANMEFTTATYNYLNFYDSNKTLILAVALASAENVIGSNNLVWTDSNLTQVKVGSGNSTNDAALKDTAFIRVSATTIDDTSVITVNESIV